MEAAADVFNRALSKVEPKVKDSAPKYIPLKKIISKLKKTGSVSDTAKLLGVSYNAIYKRLKHHGIDHEDFTDYTDDKALSHEIMQYKIAKGFSEEDIKKMPGGSKVLAICQLQDKISNLRDGASGKNNSLQVIINLANKAEEIDITPK